MKDKQLTALQTLIAWGDEMMRQEPMKFLSFAEAIDKAEELLEMEKEMKEFRKLAQLISALNEDHEYYKSIAGHIHLARKLLTTTNP